MIDADLTPTDSQTGLKIGHVMFICLYWGVFFLFSFISLYSHQKTR